jgi:hypothetical protein
VRLPNSFGNDVKLEHSLRSYIVKDVRLVTSFGNDVKLEHFHTFEVVKDARLPIHMEMMSSLSTMLYLRLSKM